MKIASIETYFFEYPLAKSFRPAWIPGHEHTVDHCVILKVTTDEGAEGLGALTALHEQHARMVKMITEGTLGPLLVGREIADINEAIQLIEFHGHALGGRPWLLEIALWDLLAKAANKPLYEYLGGDAGKLTLYASTAETLDTEASPAKALAAREAGFKAIKFRAHNLDIRDDIRGVEAVRAAVGSSMEIMVDANQACPLSLEGPRWDLDTAVEFAQAMSALDVYWLEEPLYRFNYDDLRRLRDRVEIRIAGGELNQGVHEYETMLDKDCFDIYQPDAIFSGGVAACLKIAEKVQQKGRIFCPHTWSNGIGFAVNLHIAAKVRGCPFVEFPYEPEIWPAEVWCSMLTEPFISRDGHLELPDGPGLGIELDPEAMDKYAKRL